MIAGPNVNNYSPAMNGWTLRSITELAHERIALISKDGHDENAYKYLERLPILTSKSVALKKFNDSDLSKKEY